MAKILAVCGSARKGSFNAMLLEAAVAAAPAGTTIERAGIEGIPLYDGDLEADQGIPAQVSALKDRFAAADGVLLVTPEYNNSVPGTFKNTIDWLSRPAADIPRVFGGKPFALMGATPGPGGTGLAQAAWLPVLRTLGTVPYFGARVLVSNAGKVFGEGGKVQDAQVHAQIEKFVKGFAEFVEKHRR